MKPILFRIPGLDLPIFAYGFMIMIGFIVAIAYASWRARKEGIDPNHVLDLGIILVVTGVLGARIFYYAEFYRTPFEVEPGVYKSFAERPWWTVFAIWEGGIVFYGGLIAGTLAAIGYFAWRKLPVLRACDVIAAGVPVGLSFGRIGCFLNGCCWGKRDMGGAFLSAAFPGADAAGKNGSPAWSYHVKHGWISEDSAQSLPVHLTQIYEWGAALLIAAILLVYWRYHKRDGQIFALLALLYAPVRYAIEGLRDHADAELSALPILGSVTNSQIVSIALGVVGLVGFVLATLRGPRYRSAEGEAVSSEHVEKAEVGPA